MKDYEILNIKKTAGGFATSLNIGELRNCTMEQLAYLNNVFSVLVYETNHIIRKANNEDFDTLTSQEHNN